MSLAEFLKNDKEVIDLDLVSIKPDPENARVFFDSDSLLRLSETIKARGVKTPISVRPDPDHAGHYIINHGERRYRASKLANLKTIPSIIDDDYNEDDGVIENLQRDDLTAEEIAEWIGKQLKKGSKKSDIARRIGKSNSFVTQHSNLLNLPDPIKEIFDAELVTDVTVISELCALYKKNPEEVTGWITENSNLSKESGASLFNRGSIKLFKEFLEHSKKKEAMPEPVEPQEAMPEPVEPQEAMPEPVEPQEAMPEPVEPQEAMPEPVEPQEAKKVKTEQQESIMLGSEIDLFCFEDMPPEETLNAMQSQKDSLVAFYEETESNFTDVFIKTLLAAGFKLDEKKVNLKEIIHLSVLINATEPFSLEKFSITARDLLKATAKNDDFSG